MAEKGENIGVVRKNRIWILLALLSMLLSGIADSGPKIIQELNLSNISMSYLGYNYFFALLPTLGISIKKKTFPGKKEWLIGAAMGVSILFSMFFLVMTLRTLPGTIVYPLNKTIVDVVIVLISVFIWKEKLKLKQILGVITAIAAIILLNISI
jgi:multidrug transporter EmrE-like cation transporter